MPRGITFRIKRKIYETIPVKIDRKKLYGWTEVVAVDDKGNPCNLLSTDEAGSLIIPKGGTGLGILTPKGEWVERSELKAVKKDGKPAELIPSSYDTAIELKEKVSTEDFLDHSITDFYQLRNTDPGFIKLLGNHIYTFSYTYLASYDSNPAFVLAAGNKKDTSAFLLIGICNRFEMLGYDDPGFIDETEEDTENDDGLDFSMF